MITIENKEDCCGCSACKNACPKQCIEMRADEEGFLYPSVDKTTCVECGLCEKVCPMINVKPEKEFEQFGYVVQNKDEKVLRESTSGGAFTPIAEYVINNGGVVFGASLTEDFYVKHTYVKHSSELYRFRNSKYMQSDINETYKLAEECLKSDRLVLFTGTPCQVEGLRTYLRKDYDNLIIMDVVCRAVPSPLVFKKYLEMQKEKISPDIANVRFRDKYYGYKYSTLQLSNADNTLNYHNGIDSDPYLRAFFSNICDRPSCHKCRFRKRYRVSDFTVWDCLNVDVFSKKLDNDKGATRMLIHTKKGREIFDKISNQFNYVSVKVDELVYGTEEMKKSVEPNKKRKEFFGDVRCLSGVEVFEKYFPKTAKVRIEHKIRLLLYRIGIYSFIKKVIVKLTKKYGR